MQSSKIALLLVVGLCAIQSNHGSIFSDVQDAIQDLINRVEKIVSDFEKNAVEVIGEIKDNLNNVPKCMENEKPKVTALINEVEQEAMQCLTKALSDAKPTSDKVGKIIGEVIPLAQKTMPELLKCEMENQNPITLTMCVVRVLGPAMGQVINIVNEIRDEIPEFRKLVEEQIIPLFQECSAKVDNQITHLREIVADLEKCVSNNQS